MKEYAPGIGPAELSLVDVPAASADTAKAVAGDKGKGNTGDGVRIAGTNNNTNQSKASANKSNGFELSGGTAGSPNILTNDVSNTRSTRRSTARGIRAVAHRHAVAGFPPRAA